SSMSQSVVSQLGSATSGVADAGCELASSAKRKDLRVGAPNQKKTELVSSFIPVSEPNLSGKETAYVLDCLKTGWVSSLGNYIPRFEKEFADFVGAKEAIALCNGTAALHAALLALGIGPGDEVIVPTFTYIASANAVRYTGARPIFVDMEADTWNPD